MSNQSPWGNIKLKKTGLNELRTTQENEAKSQIFNSQDKLQNIANDNKSRYLAYEDRQASLAADAMYGKQNRYNYGGKLRKYKTSKFRKSRKSRKSRRNRTSRKY